MDSLGTCPTNKCELKESIKARQQQASSGVLLSHSRQRQIYAEQRG
jgi:hypothetical protein